MRSRLAAHAQSRRLGLPHQTHALLRGDVADVVLAARSGRQFDVALHLPPLALGADSPVAALAAVHAVVDIPAAQQIVHLAMGHDRPADGRRTAHRLLHEFGRLHAASVVRKAHDPRGQRPEVHQLPAAALPHRDRAVGFHAHRGVAADDLHLPLQRLRRVGRGI